MDGGWQEQGAFSEERGSSSSYSQLRQQSAWAERKASLKMALHVGEHRAFVCCSMVF
ncbi:hypothetical protein DAI22_04g265000 [Oryza sativa Japonica Group]|nr:hypothetical protein DAI22_04g265000 [Oryza sativa Japonica Group]